MYIQNCKCLCNTAGIETETTTREIVQQRTYATYDNNNNYESFFKTSVHRLSL